MKLKHPTSVFVRRNDPKRDRSYTPQVNVRRRVLFEPEEAPKPVPDSAFYGVGRDAQHATPHIWTYNHLAIADKLSIAAQHFLVPRVMGVLAVSQGFGRQNPTVERVNIDSPESVSLGDTAAVRTDRYFHPTYAKLTL